MGQEADGREPDGAGVVGQGGGVGYQTGDGMGFQTHDGVSDRGWVPLIWWDTRHRRGTR